MREYMSVITRIDGLKKLSDLYPRCQYFIIKHAIKKGYKVLILNFTKTPKKRRYLRESVEVIDIPYAPNILAVYSSLSSILFKIFKKIEIIYLEAWPLRNLLIIFPLIKYAKKSDIVVVGDIYDLFPIYEMDLSMPFMKKHKLLYNIEINLWKEIYDNMDLIFFVSPEEHKVANKLFNIPQEKVRILFYGVDTRVFNNNLYSRNYGLMKNTINICWIGNNAIKKHLPTALLSISRSLKDKKIRFIIGGKINSKTINLLCKYLKNIHYLGKVSYKYSAKIYAKECNILIAPVNPNLIHNQISIFEKPIQSLLLTKPVIFTMGMATYNYLKSLGINNYRGYIVINNNLLYGKSIEYIIDNYDYFVKEINKHSLKLIQTCSREKLCKEKLDIMLKKI